MSAITSRPRIRAVSCTQLSASALLTSGAVVLSSRQTIDAIRANTTMRPTLESSPMPVPTDLRSVASSRRDMLAAERRVLATPPVAASPIDVLKVSVLEGLAAAGFAAHPTTLQQPLKALDAATTPAGVETARGELLRAVEASHLQVLTTALGEACREASVKAGFDRVEIQAEPHGSNTRVVAYDQEGRALVSEVRVAEGSVGVETEVIGVHDGTCTAILDRFDHALEAGGVRADRVRAFTGGVCTLAAARAAAARLNSRPTPAKRSQRVASRVTVARNRNA